MIEQTFGKSFAGSAPENYERYFVPTITKWAQGAPGTPRLPATAVR
jgi:hypothetical protein